MFFKAYFGCIFWCVFKVSVRVFVGGLPFIWEQNILVLLKKNHSMLRVAKRVGLVLNCSYKVFDIDFTLCTF